MLKWIAALLVTLPVALPAIADDQAVVLTGEALAENLRAELLAELEASPAPETRFEARRQARRAAERLSDYLNSRGYFDAHLEPSVEIGPPLEPIVTIDPGPQFQIGEVTLEFEGDAPLPDAQQSAKAALQISTGDRAFPENVLAAERRALASLRRSGYAFAGVNTRDVIGDAPAATIDVGYMIASGPRIRLGEVVFDGEMRTRRAFRDRLIPFEYGDLFKPETLNELNRRLGETRLYSIYAAQLSDTAREITPEGDEVRDVEITLRERARYTIATGASYSTSEGPGITLEWTRRNATRRGDIISISTVLAEQERSLEASWNIPNVLGYGRNFMLSAEGGRDETDAFDRDYIIFGGQLDLYQNEHLTYALGVASEFTRETDLEEERELQIYSVSGGARLDYADSVLDPTTGWRADGRVEPGIVTGEESANFVSVSGQVSAYRALNDEKNFVLAGRVHSGLVFGTETLDLPTSRRFYAGGGGSARGYSYQAIGPRDDDDTPIGGRGILELSAEARWRRSETLGYAAFVDAASVTTRDVPSFTDLQYGIGAGVRYYTAVGPIRLDLATPLNRQSGDEPVQVYISIGQAF